MRVAYLEQDPDFPKELSVIDACLRTDNDAVRTIAAYEHCMMSKTQEGLDEILSQMDLHKAWDYETRIKQAFGKLKITNFDQLIGNLWAGNWNELHWPMFWSENQIYSFWMSPPTTWSGNDRMAGRLLKRSSMALLMVTHDRYFLDRVCTNILEIDHQALYQYSGNYSYYLEKRQERIENFNAETERTVNLYRKELDWMRRQPQARAHKAKSRQDSFYEIEERAKQRRNNDKVANWM